MSVDGANGDVVDRLPFSELPLFSKLTQWGIYLHMGIMFGLPLLGISFAAMLTVDRLLAGRPKSAVAAEGNAATGAEADLKAERELQPA